MVPTHIRNLRLKIARALDEEPIIHTVPGPGYALRQPAEVHGRRELA